jgi:hypothetical protein
MTADCLRFCVCPEVRYPTAQMQQHILSLNRSRDDSTYLCHLNEQAYVEAIQRPCVSRAGHLGALDGRHMHPPANRIDHSLEICVTTAD